MEYFGINEEKLLKAYPKFNSNKDFYLSRIKTVVEGFKKTFSHKEPRIFSAPGRTEVGGNHTDHQHGCVLAAAVDLDVLAAALPNGTDYINILSECYEMEKININDLTVKAEEKNTSASLIRGVAAAVVKKGYKIGGFDMYAISNVLKGSGLSSSAAYEVMLGVVMNSLFCNGEITPVEIAQMGQFAENVYFGKMSGLMDQTASSVGSMVSIDFEDTDKPVVKKVDLDLEKYGYSLCIIDTGADHADLSDEYSAIPFEMKEVAKVFGKEYLRQVDEKKFFENIDKVRKECGDRGTLRAIHFFDDNKRAVLEAELIENGDFDKFLSTVTESGYSSFMYLQNVSVCGRIKNQEVALALAVCHKALDGKGAFRVHGGGFAGTIQAFVPNEILDEFKVTMEKAVGEGRCHVLSIRNAGGVELTEAM